MAFVDNAQWRRRMATYFNIIETDSEGNNDGILTRDDYGVLADRYSDLGKLDERTKKQIHRKLIQIYDTFFGDLANDGPIDSKRFADAFISKGPELMIRACSQFFGFYFDLVDINGDGVVSRQEYELFTKGFRLSEEGGQLSFAAVDVDGDGKISYEEFVSAGTDYFLGRGGENIDHLYGKLIDTPSDE